MRRATRKISLDSNHREICDELRKLGVDVEEVLEPVDIIARLTGAYWGFIEIKPDGRGTYRRKQLKFMSETRMPVAIARTASEAMKFLKTGVGLSQQQKDRIAGFLVRNQAEKWNSEQIEQVLAI